MMKKIKLLFAGIFLVLFTTACVGEEPNEVGHITALGIDKRGENYLFTIQFANPTKISGGASEEGGKGGEIVENISVKSPTLYAAINTANSIVSKDLSLSHAKIIVVSKEIAKQGLKEITNIIARNNDIRPDIYLAVAENSGAYIENVKPVIELNPVKYYQLTYESNKGAPIPQNNAADFYMTFLSGDRDGVLPLAGVAENKDEGTQTKTDSKEEESQKPTENSANEKAKDVEGGFQEKTRDYIAGQAGVAIKNKSESIGMAVFDGDKYVECFGSADVYIYNMLTKGIGDIKTTFYTDKDKDPMTVNVVEKKKPSFRIDKNKKMVKINIEIETELLSVPAQYSEKTKLIEVNKKNEEMIEKACEKFIDKFYGNYAVDILGIKGKLKRNFLTYDKYNEYIKSFKESEWNFDVNVYLEMKRTGMTYYY